MFFQSFNKTTSIISEISQFNAIHIFNKILVLTFSFFNNFAIEVLLIPALTAKSFLVYLYQSTTSIILTPKSIHSIITPFTLLE